MTRRTLQLNELASGDILRRILAILGDTILTESYGIKEHRCVAILATVCREWEACLRLRLRSTVILEYIRNERAVNNTWRKWLRNSLLRREPRNVWVSNAVSVGGSLMQTCCKELRIVNKTGENTFEFASALFQTGFAAYAWPGIRSLKFVGSFSADPGNFNVSTASVVSVSIIQCLPGLTAINHAPYPLYSGSHLTEVIDCLLCHYLPQLQSLSLSGAFPKVQLQQAVENLTKVDLDASAIAGTINLSCIPVAQLRALRITNLTREFPWHRFVSATSADIEFTCLQQLDLLFARSNKGPVPIGADLERLRFPQLRRLCVSRSFGMFTDFYSIFNHSPLEAFDALEDTRCVEDISTGIISSLNRLTLNTTKDALVLRPSWVAAIDKYLSTKSAVQSAYLGGFPYQFSGTVLWPDLQQLTLEVYSIDWQSVGHLLTQLPSLWYLEVWYDHMQPVCNQPENQPGNAALQLASGTGPLSTSLQELIVYIDDPWTASLDTATLCTLISRVPSLLKTRVPEDAVPEIETFALTSSRNFSIKPTFLRTPILA